jgi:glycosyltransferase involved in cell wall biosynthesis
LICPQGDLLNAARDIGLETIEMTYPDVHLRLGFMPVISIKAVIRLARLLKLYKVDVVHAESLLGLYYGGLAARLLHKPCVATYHGYWPLHSKATRHFLRWFCARAYPVSRAMLYELRVPFQGLETRLRIIPLNVNSRFLAELPSRGEIRLQLGMPLNRQLVLHFARFQQIKGQHRLLEALTLLIEDMGVDAPIVIFVGGVMEPASSEILQYRAVVEAQAAQPHLRANVLFFGARQDIPQLMKAADVIVSPSDFESFGMTLIEAMIVGTPVVATNAGGPGEILENNKTGLLVPSGDSRALAYGITRILSDSALAQRLAQAAREVAIVRYSPKRRSETLLAEYRELLGR